MYDLQDKQNGFSALALVIGMAVISLAGLYVNSSYDRVKNSVSEAKLERLHQDKQIGLMSSVSRTKALFSLKQYAKGQYIPAIYASNYYSRKWRLVRSPTANAVTQQGDSVLIGVPRFSQSFQPLDVVNGPKDFYRIEILRQNFSKSNSSVVDSLDLSVREMGKPRPSAISVRLPIPRPIPLGISIEYGPKGTNSFKPLTSGTVLNLNKHEFLIRGSGVIFDAAVFVDNREYMRVGGINPNTKSISHSATSYASINQAIGSPFSLEIIPPKKGVESGKSSSAIPLISKEEWNPDTCTYNPSKSAKPGNANPTSSLTTMTLNAVAYGPDRRFRSATDPIEIQVEGAAPPVASAPTKSKTGDGKHALTENDYKELCNEECPFTGDDSQPLLDATAKLPSSGIMSGPYARFYAEQFHITNKKLCWDMRGFKPGTISFADVPILLYDVRTCKPSILFKAKEWKYEKCI